MWNYRVVRRTENGIEYFAIHEAYYDDNGKVWGITEEPSHPYGETIEELKEDTEWFHQAFIRPVLDYDKIPEEGAVNPAEEQKEEIIKLSEVKNLEPSVLEELKEEMRMQEYIDNLSKFDT